MFCNKEMILVLADAFTTRDLMSRWYNTTTEQFSPVELGNEVPLPEFNITGTVTGDCSATYTSGKTNLHLSVIAYLLYIFWWNCIYCIILPRVS